jgi:hypothetical protein
VRALLTTLVLFAMLSGTASAVSLDEIVRLSQAGVSDEVLLALIDRDKPVFAIEPEQLVALKRAGVSQLVILAMLKSGRQLPAAPPASSEALKMVAPDVTIVGHGPDVPNVSSPRNDTIFLSPLVGAFVFVGPRPCLAAAPKSRPYILIGPPNVGRMVPDPNSRFENDSPPASGGHRSRLAPTRCHSTTAPARLHRAR